MAKRYKYVARIGNPGHYRYFYSQSAYDKYNSKGETFGKVVKDRARRVQARTKENKYLDEHNKRYLNESYEENLTQISGIRPNRANKIVKKNRDKNAPKHGYKNSFASMLARRFSLEFLGKTYKPLTKGYEPKKLGKY